MRAGGQAVIEGVLMIARKVSLAVRKPDGNIEIRELGKVKFPGWAKIPFLRGFYSLFVSLYFGIKALNLSSEISSGERLKESEKLFSLITAIGLAVGLFVIVPIFLTNFLVSKKGEFLYSLVEGFIRFGLFLLYVWIISLFKDVKRVFQYHGAEHMTIHAYEHGEELTPENVRKYSTIHPRCGTNFLMIFLIVAILLLGLVGVVVEMNTWTRIVSRLVLLPFAAGISYELLKVIAFFNGKGLVKLLYLPGYLLQYLTTAKPDDSQLEVAITALKHAVGEEKNTTEDSVKEDEVELLG
ncbi:MULTISPECIES: DUF1385 domain-containing protein [unclassified Thermotoga]|uniref:DUF1385 domain-containing protein n=1 Tax=unclassified Thermotoga TaxID=2631113 RepID=UPI00054258BF|nr:MULTISPECIES: DUF1385 domain-containing protein [unclassified Thermotoga]KAF2960547.1 metal-dependent enzyme [Thermotoga sp. 38H-to]KHC91814.1 hypothetical protein Mc24_03563 [Thermotoga sp. Mc24]